MLRRHAEAVEAARIDRQRRKEFPRIWRHVAELVDGGVPEATAMNIVAARLGCGLETVEWWMTMSARRSASYKAWRRNREIFQRAHVLSNRDLGELYGLTPGQISRIIREQLRRRWRRDVPAQFP
ncbi:hypothetical protein [Parvibaculum sp.]|uniref:hypothetical protein n=1 Tax=Parvibaculum sp. TaxID=2024848 RepID=UPI00260DC48B|nr:hypothetical protein [Parvibaculum sp.]MCW5728162.1 hypothetical protein [Parvibaculum sp.]